MRRILLIVPLFVLMGCMAAPPQVSTAVISLSQLDPLPVAAPTEVVPLRVAVAAVISPKGNVDSYGSLLAYLGQQIERPVTLVQRRTYAEINELVKNGDVDMAFVCTSAYVSGAREFGMELLAAPQVDGDTVYYSLLIVPVDSPAEDMEDLRGGVFAFTDPMSNSGRNYPTFLVHELGETPESFFSRTFFTYSHDDAIRAVANHVADGAAVDSLVYDFAVSREPELKERTKIIHISPAFGIPPVVVGPHVRPQVHAEIETILMEMGQSTEGKAALAAAGIEQFVQINDTAYDSVRFLEAEISNSP